MAHRKLLLATFVAVMLAGQAGVPGLPSGRADPMASPTVYARISMETIATIRSGAEEDGQPTGGGRGDRERFWWYLLALVLVNVDVTLAILYLYGYKPSSSWLEQWFGLVVAVFIAAPIVAVLAWHVVRNLFDFWGL